ncbi:hypothetical protein BDV36DRAFT_306572 [Aspergillus pseudocaelatus]|uniref:Uncharacterized protein n=1 Tax=Aspergillus pseudocaelatus TaxID=1825620 RepID=A0ABQ6W471_9EURO|nr:hypothetical protein BDV36DRAFT_306572 [Aspergillus pseudocaelatus]
MASTPAAVHYDTELMKNQKNASSIDPAKQFDVLQNSDGKAVFFSIGSDNVLNVSQETAASPTGWTKWDISTAIAGRFGQASITAKTFAVSQNLNNPANVDIALVASLEGQGQDNLFLAYDVPNEPSSWEQSWYWEAAFFDAPGRPMPMPFLISNVYLMNIFGKGRLCFVDVIRNPTENNRVIDRYYIRHGASPIWSFHPLPNDVRAGSVSCLGKRPKESVGGIYTLASVGPWTQEVIYTPARTEKDARSIRLPTLTGSTAIASMLDESGNTFLFIAWPSDGAIAVWTPHRQNNGDWAQMVIDTDYTAATGILRGTTALVATRLGSRTVLWGLNGLGELYSASCPSGSETDQLAWSDPIAVCFDVLQFAHYPNVAQSSANNVLFAQTQTQTLDQQLTMLTQNLNTSLWTERSVLLPPESVNTVTEYYSYTSHIQVVDENDQGVPNYSPVFLTGLSPVSVYVNDVYHVLTPDVPLPATTNSSGVITIVQEIQSLSGILIGVVVLPPGSDKPISTTIDPHANAAQRLATLDSAQSLRGATITDSNGYQKPLVPASVSDNDMKIAAEKFQKLLYIRSQMPSNGGRQLKPFSAVSAGPFRGNTISEEKLRSRISLLWGDLARWLKKFINKVESITAQIIDGFWNFVVEVGDLIYSAVMDTVSAVVGAVEYVFHEINVAYDDIVQYLGFIFNWADIKRTHFVIKNIIKVSTAHAVNSITDIEDGIKREFSTIQERLENWDKMPDVGGTIGQQQQLQSNVKGCKSPQANWALHHATSSIQNAQTSHDRRDPISKDIEKAFQDIYYLLKNEETAVVTMVTQLKDLLMNFSSLTAAQVCQQALGIISEFILETAEDCLLTFLDLAKLLADAVFTLLDAPLNIPILSPIYKDITGDQLSFLDLACFIGAVPATILYKVVTNATPFPTDDPLGDALIQAPDYATLSKLLNSTELDKYQQQAYRKYLTIARISKPRTIRPAKAYDLCEAVSNFVAAFASLGYIPMTIAKSVFDFKRTPAPKALRYTIPVVYMGYVMPDIIGSLSDRREWYTILNWYYTAISIVKAGLDSSDTIGTNSTYSGWVNPIIETGLNICWLVPAVGDFVDNHDTRSDIAAFYANVLFDAGGSLSAGASEDLTGAEVAADMRVAQTLLSLGYFGCVTATGYFVTKGQ